MSSLDVSKWEHVGNTSNAAIYKAEPELLVIVPIPNCPDTESTARESIAFQDRYWRSVGHRGAVVVYMDNVVAQDSGARAVYANETQRSLTTCYALVGETFFGYAVSTVFTGLARPGIPTQVFPNLDAARGFIAQMNQERGGSV